MAFANHILVPTDYSEASELAVNAASLLAERLGAKLTLVHVHDPGALRPPAQIAFNAEKQKDLDTQVREANRVAIDEVKARVEDTVKEVGADLIDHPSAAQGIVEHATRVGADLIVIATHGRTGLKHLLIGSVAERVVRFATVPVLTLRSNKKD